MLPDLQTGHFSLSGGLRAPMSSAVCALAMLAQLLRFQASASFIHLPVQLQGAEMQVSLPSRYAMLAA